MAWFVSALRLSREQRAKSKIEETAETSGGIPAEFQRRLGAIKVTQRAGIPRPRNAVRSRRGMGRTLRHLGGEIIIHRLVKLADLSELSFGRLDERLNLT